LNKVTLKQKLLSENLDGSVVEGLILERTSTTIRLSDAFDVLEERASGGFGPYFFKGTHRGNVEIPFTSVKMTRNPSNRSCRQSRKSAFNRGRGRFVADAISISTFSHRLAMSADSSFARLT
jgi:hypothetical protein